MELSWLQSLLVGLVSGMAEILPISAQAHRAILLHIFGATTDSYLLRLFTHAAVFAAVFFTCRSQLRQLGREKALIQTPKRRRKRQPDWTLSMDLRIMRTVAVFLLLGLAIYFPAVKLQMKLNVIAGFLFLNGVLMFIPAFLPQANKDSRNMSRFDGFLFGILSALGYLPGVSRIGGMISAATIRGADKMVSLRWAIVLTLPAMVLLMAADVYGLITSGIGIYGMGGFALCLLSAAGAYIGTVIGIKTMQFLSVKTGYCSFAFYSWGAALFAFIIYLTT